MGQVVSEVEWKGRTGPFTLALRPGVFSPTSTSKTLADALEIGPDDTVIDVGCGSGVLAFVAARLGAKKVYGCDLSGPAVETARENAVRLGLDDVCEFRQGDLLVTLVVDTPTDLSPVEEDLLRRLAEERGDDVAPPGQGLLSRLRSAFK